MLPSPASGTMDSSVAAPLKRPASDSSGGGPEDPVPPPAKRRETDAPIETAPIMVPNGAIPWQLLDFEITRDQLRGRGPEDLAELILQMQSRYSRQLAALSAQYEAVNQQLLDIKKSISTYFSAQSTAMEAAATVGAVSSRPR